MKSIIGWVRRLGGFGKTTARAKIRPDRGPSLFESLERRQVLTVTPLATLAALPVEVTPIAPTAYATPVTTSGITALATPSTTVGMPTSFAVATPTVTSTSTSGQPLSVSSTVAPVYYTGQPVVSGVGGGISALNQDTDYVQALYRTVLDRVGSPGEVSSWVAQMGEGMTIPQVAASFVNSTEHRQDEVDSYYEEFLHRTPDVLAADWVNALQAGASEESVVEGILDMPEYQNAHPTSVQLIQGLYNDVLGRQADPAGYAQWGAAVAAGESPSELVANFVNSSEAIDQVIEDYYVDYLHRQPDLAISSQWAAELASPTGSATDLAIGILSSAEFVQDSEQA